jgi:hypothetical protein
MVKGTTKVNGHFLKLHFCMFERSQVKHKNLDCYSFLEYFSLIAKFTCSKVDINQKCFCMFKALKLMDFENVFLTKVVHINVIEGMNA